MICSVTRQASRATLWRLSIVAGAVLVSAALATGTESTDGRVALAWAVILLACAALVIVRSRAERTPLLASVRGSINRRSAWVFVIGFGLLVILLAVPWTLAKTVAFVLVIVGSWAAIDELGRLPTD
jgi:hypothetical protein